MESETLSNLIQGTISLLMCVGSLISGIYTGMDHCFWIAAGCALFAAFFYWDSEYGYESVIAYFIRKFKK